MPPTKCPHESFRLQPPPLPPTLLVPFSFLSSFLFLWGASTISGASSPSRARSSPANQPERARERERTERGSKREREREKKKERERERERKRKKNERGDVAKKSLKLNRPPHVRSGGGDGKATRPICLPPFQIGTSRPNPLLDSASWLQRTMGHQHA